MRTAYEPSPFQLNITIGADGFRRIVELQGVAGWNRWLRAMASDYMPLSFGEGDPVPPVWYWLDFEDADLSGRDLSGVDLKTAWLKNCDFDESTLAGARIGTTPFASFRSTDLRRADFTLSDITGADFSDARLDGIRMDGAAYDEGRPPIGLPDDLLRRCRPEPAFIPHGTGTEEHTVPIIGSLTALRIQEAR